MRVMLILLLVGLATGPSAAQEAVEGEAIAFDGADKAVVEMAMKRSSEGADRKELDLLPLPATSPYQSTHYALEFPSAWIDGAAALHKNDDAIVNVQMLAFEGGRRFYSEWACETGQERAVAAQVIGLLPRLVTTYPERLLLRGFINERRLYGFDRVRRCDQSELASARMKFDKYYAEVSKLAVTAK